MLATPGGPSLTGQQSPPFTIPMRYMLLGMIGFVFFAVDLVAQVMELGQGNLGSPKVIAVTHLLTLGSLVAFVMGAVYQLSTVAFLVPVASQKLARWNFWLYLISIVGLIPSMSAWWSTGLILFGTLAAVSVTFFAVNIIVTVLESKVGGPMKWFVAMAHFYLILAVSFGVLLVLSTRTPVLSVWIAQLVESHVLLATGGFFTFLVMGFSLKLLPMFTLSHGWTDRRARITFGMANAAMVALIVDIWLDWTIGAWIGGLCALVAFVVYGMDLRTIVKKRLRKKVEIPIRSALVAAGTGAVGILLVLLVLALRAGDTGWQAVVVLYLLGWISLTVMAYAYKIVPFLIWTRRYSKRAGKDKKVPLISDIIDVGRSLPVFIGFIAGFVLLSAGAAFTLGVLAVAGTVLVGLSVIIFALQMMRVIDIPVALKELTSND